MINGTATVMNETLWDHETKPGHVYYGCHIKTNGPIAVARGSQFELCVFKNQGVQFRESLEDFDVEDSTYVPCRSSHGEPRPVEATDDGEFVECRSHG